MNADVFEQIREEAKGLLSGAKGSHGWDHTERVYNLCMHIGKKENADLEILGIAAVLHDIARDSEDESNGKICHAEEGAKMARELLEKHGISKEKIEKVVHCIQCHRFRANNVPRSKEARILFDADKLDCIGAVGVGRAFLFAGEIGANLHDKGVDVGKTEQYSKDDTAYREFLVKLRKIKDRMLTEEGKRIAKERHGFMAEFFDRLNQEVDGEL